MFRTQKFTNKNMINKERLKLLTDKEKKLYLGASSNLTKINTSGYSVLNVNNTRYVLCENEREENKPNFLFTGKALAGVLLEGETLEDFLLFKEYMKPVLKHRGDEFEKLKRFYKEKKS